MKLGKVCAIHDEFASDGECRWCMPPPSEVFPDVGEEVDFTTGGGPLQIVYGPLQQQHAGGAGPLNVMPPLPVASCKHDGALLDFSGTISCAACGKVLKAPVPCEMLATTHMATCGAVSAWRWVAESGAALAAPKKEYFFCDLHGKSPVGGWRADPIPT